MAVLAAAIVFLLSACPEVTKDDPEENGEKNGDKNGITWTAVPNSTFGTNAINSVTFGNGVFVAVGGGGRIARSADGKTWTAVTETTFGTNAINSVDWGGPSDNRIFMAGGENGRMAYSADGTTWTAVSNSTFTTNEINGISWGSDRWVAVGRGRMAYSNADGTSWTGMSSNDPFGYGQGSPNLRDAAWGGGRYVIVGPAGGQGHGTSLAHSANGITWTSRDMGDIIATPLTGICYGNGKFVTVASDMILYSADGMNWSDVPDLNTGSILKQLVSVAAGDGKFLAVGTNDTIVMSDDGIKWNALPDILLNSHLNGAAYGNSTWVAAGLNGVIAYAVED